MLLVWLNLSNFASLLNFLSYFERCMEIFSCMCVYDCRLFESTYSIILVWLQSCFCCCCSVLKDRMSGVVLDSHFSLFVALPLPVPILFALWLRCKLRSRESELLLPDCKLTLCSGAPTANAVAWSLCARPTETRVSERLQTHPHTHTHKLSRLSEPSLKLWLDDWLAAAAAASRLLTLH